MSSLPRYFLPLAEGCTSIRPLKPVPYHLEQRLVLKAKRDSINEDPTVEPSPLRVFSVCLLL
ncbi:hypothetical protein Scep_002423 [Stephania cephalantha]|uniref:Uncharacterized protein n=1 Tax=Stephania cephalantha TaxID=152367 RepID=A0AAP0L9W4_9MAGN